MDSSDDLKKKIINKIKNYFIDDKIHIKENDDINTKIKKFLLKYKRIIGLVLLICLLLIGYNCNPYNINNISNENSKIIQNGGGGEGAPASTPAPATGKEGASGGIADVKAAIGSDEGKKTAKEKALGAAKKVGKGIKNVGTGMYDAGAAVAHKFTGSADLIFQVLFSIAIFIVLCIVIVPSLALFIIGIICYVLLKGKMKGIKAL